MSAELAVRSEPSGIGRPREYTPEDAQRIVDTVKQGQSLTGVCADLGIPVATVWRWKADDPSFALALALARKESADALASQVLEIADDQATGQSHEAVGHARLRIQARQWLASKYNAQSYGDKLDVSGDLTVAVTIRKFSPSVDAAIDVTPE